VPPEPSTSIRPDGSPDPFGLLVESAADAVLTVDANGVVLTCNAAVERMFGRARSDVLGRDVRLLVPRPPGRDAPARDGPARWPEAGDVGQRRVAEGRRPDGSTFAIEVTIAGFDVAGDRRFGILVRDPGRVEVPPHRARKMAALGRFAAGVAGDVDDCLAAIRERCDALLAALPPDDALRGDVGGIRTASEQAATLTRQLLAVSRRELSPRLLDLNDVVVNLERMLHRLLGGAVPLRHAFDPLRPVVVADLAQLEQVLVTLVVDARDAMPSGGELTLATRVSTPDDGSGRVEGVRPGRFGVLTVAAAGVAIGASAAGARGLAAADAFAVESGGHLAVTGGTHGSEVRLYLPMADTPLPAAARGSPMVRAATGGHAILVVEDDAFLRGLTADFLQTAGYVVRVAGLGLEAMDEASDEPIDLLITDMALPDMSGRDLATRLSARHSALKVLFISGYPEAALDGGPMDGARQRYLQKPFAPAALAGMVRALLGGADGQREAYQE
jgi:PAS domain S-box-containing protein